MTEQSYMIVGMLVVVGVLLGIVAMSRVKSARFGNAVGAFWVALAVVMTLGKHELLTNTNVLLALLAGAGIGAVGAWRVKMIQMPQYVAVLNGLGGLASALVAFASLRTAARPEQLVALIALAIGLVTASGSAVAAGKLARLLRQQPVVLKGHAYLTGLLGLVTLAAIVWREPWTVIVGALLFGVVFALRVGGADMPITISLLNSLSGVAGGVAGIAIGDPVLTCVGGVVGASGLLLTQIMSRAMNRSLVSILLGKTTQKTTGKKDAAKVSEKKPAADAAVSGQMAAKVAGDTEGASARKAKSAPEAAVSAAEVAPAVVDSSPEAPIAAAASSLAAKLDLARVALRAAVDVIIVPGYGMALSQAQLNVKMLADRLTAGGAKVRYAIHPVAGRMPGHMNVLLCEVDVPYEQLFELDDINDDFAKCDLVVVVGANDTINPAANTAEDTPIYGMPVLAVADAPMVIICNLDDGNGYAGVPNTLYQNEKAVLMTGDAKETLTTLLEWLMTKD